MKLTIKNKFAFFGGLAYFIIMLAFFGIKLLAFFGLLNFPNANEILKIVIQVGLMFGFSVLLFSAFNKTKPQKTFSYFSFQKVSGKTVGLSFLLGICVFVLVCFISNFWSNFLALLGYKGGESSATESYSWVSFVLSIVLSCALPAICEETAHRGLALFSMKKNGAVRAVVLSGLLFGLMHFNIVQFGYAFLVGMFFGAITMLTKSIIPAIIMHFTNNFLGTVWTFSINSTWLKNNIVDGILNFFSNANFLICIIVELCVLFITLWFVYYLIVKLFQESKKASYLRFKQKFAQQIKSSKLESEIDIKNDEQIFQIYRNTQLLKLQEQLDKENKSMLEVMNMGGKGALEFLLNDGFKTKQQPNSADYVFFYLALALGIGGTIWTFVLGVL